MQKYDAVIIGGGVSGCALFFVLTRYTNLSSVALLEKYDHIAPLNSSVKANSQTLHSGDIETNYTLEKAARVKRIANMIVRYGELVPDAQACMRALPKMVLAVGEQEVEYLRARHREFAAVFPYLQLWDKRHIAELEPAVAMADGGLRPEPLAASGALGEICAVDYGGLSESFARNAQAGPMRTDLLLDTPVRRITERDGGFELDTGRGTIAAGCVVVAAGPHSLLFAHQMGYGRNFSMLPVAGSFYFIDRPIRSKIYTVQNPKLPFAALHADPDLAAPGRTRLGPTALILPKMERYRGGSYGEFLRVFRPDRGVMKVMWDLIKDADIRRYILRNLLFEVPLVRKRLFVKEARKIIPALTVKELQFARGFGGLRPQVIDRAEARLQLGEASINSGTGIIFNMTPSPGASTCLGNAYRDAGDIAARLGATLDRDRLVRELLDGEDLEK